ncbi:sensor domain-containing diguanylate cyclase [Ancylobacter terrae]|uniref:sensor domain-containing diguanylate cyclase n=1 Tax=Ancylobacter sp. sgz301288 TaxID=3342077 RepID=UPI00385D76E5
MAELNRAGTAQGGGPSSRRHVPSIRRRLGALTALILALLMGERIFSILSERSERLDAVNRQVLDLTDRGVSVFRETVAMSRGALQALALDLQQEVTTPGFCDSLPRVVDATHGMQSMSIIDAQGIATCSTAPGVAGIDVSRRDYFRVAMTGTFNVSSVGQNYVSRRPLVVASQPVIGDSGDIIAVLVGQFALDDLIPISIIADLDVSAVALLIDPEGIVISAYPDATRWLGQNLKNTELVTAILPRSHGTITSSGPDGIARVYGFERLPGTNMRLAIGLSAASVMAPIEAAAFRAVAIFATACLLVFAGLWLAGEKLVVQPVQLLAARLASFGRGEDALAPPDTGRIAELEPLITAFGAMARQLTQRENALRQANQQLLSLASLDPLTGLANRRAFDRAMAALWQGPSRTVAMLMIDVDQFKAYNDMYGHGEGDACLRRIAAALGASVRGSDLIARLGGEEFALLMPDSDLATASDVANRLRTMVESLDIRHAGTPGGRVTVSVGYAACQSGRSSEPSDLLAAADGALYEAKRAGRNTCRAGALRADSLLLRRTAGGSGGRAG